MVADEVIVQELATKMAGGGVTLVNLRSEHYPETKHFSYRRFNIQWDQNDVDLLLKKAQTDPTLRQAHSIKGKFQNEVIFYSQVVPKLRPVLEKMRENETTTHNLVVPNYYGHDMTEGHEWLAVEDLGPEYKGFSEAENLDKEHLKASVQALAAFHSASINWRLAGPTEYLEAIHSLVEMEIFQPDETDSTILKTQKISSAMAAATKICSAHLTGSYTTSFEKVCQSAHIEPLLWVSIEKAEPWSVITHGNCWAKNFLYKYDKIKKISGVAIVDFKCSRAGSPVLDVTNFLLSSASSECLKDLRPFIEKHKDSMNPKIPDYRSHVHLFGPYGLVSALVHHYFDVLYPTLDTAEAARLMENPDEAEQYEFEKNKETKKSVASMGKDNAKEIIAGRDKRVALVVKAAHDVRII